MRSRQLLSLAAAVAMIATLTACGDKKPVQPKKAEQAQQQTGTIDLRTTKPPWPAPMDNNKKYVDAAGLPALQKEGTLVHYHAHLDVVVDGKPVEVPANVGIIFDNGKAVAISPLHTHQPDGVLHVEADENAKFTLGQFFTEWDLRLSQSCIGALCTDQTHDLAFAVDGVSYDGNPLDIVLKPHEEIAIVYGEKGKLPKPPASYTFPAGE